VGALMSRLMKIADEYNVAVVITNQARARMTSVGCCMPLPGLAHARAARCAAAPAGDG
jgi:hypothetical protein